MPEGDDHGAAKQQVIAQSLTSLGNLFLTLVAEIQPLTGEVELGKETAPARAKRKVLVDKALENLLAAKEAYIKGFHEGHPKVHQLPSPPRALLGSLLRATASCVSGRVGTRGDR